jgi:hypothetical protein
MPGPRVRLYPCTNGNIQNVRDIHYHGLAGRRCAKSLTHLRQIKPTSNSYSYFTYSLSRSTPSAAAASSPDRLCANPPPPPPLSQRRLTSASSSGLYGNASAWLTARPREPVPAGPSRGICAGSFTCFWCRTEASSVFMH